MATPLVLLGEVHTGLVPSSTPLGRADADEVLALLPGCSVSWLERPIRLATSPAVGVGVDCRLRVGAEVVPIVGTVATRARLVGGWTLQSSACTRVCRSGDRRKQTWSYYLGRKGTTELIGRLPEIDSARTALAEGYLTGPPGREILDMAAISDHLMNHIRFDSGLDRRPPLRTRTTRLRWTACLAGNSRASVSFHLGAGHQRAMRVAVRTDRELRAVQQFCEDVAAHDWLLTVVTDVLDAAERRLGRSHARIDDLSAVLHNLTGLWIPGGHVPPEVRGLWKGLQIEPGFSRQWSLLTTRVRDKVASQRAPG
ncbi:SCO2521 family protein [Nocardia aurea]|uniref:SCO2521 family protein n=1 Tax=Nocardia aurea TaxID=2144174 RepID=A0ABV3FU23_9NOCA